jgi:peptidyl-tRNA hydrolase, PTH1 family
MKLIIWLWNPGKQYEKTRHNIWFMFLDFFVSKNTFSEFKLESKFKWEISTWIFEWEKTILLKPQTFMNLSWESVKKISDFYKIDPEEIIVIFDDLSLKFGKIRFREKGSAWGHNWIKDIIKHSWEIFKRIKVWIWFNDNYEVSDWVLSKFTYEEIGGLEDDIFNEIYNLLEEKI